MNLIPESVFHERVGRDALVRERQQQEYLNLLQLVQAMKDGAVKPEQVILDHSGTGSWKVEPLPATADPAPPAVEPAPPAEPVQASAS